MDRLLRNIIAGAALVGLGACEQNSGERAGRAIDRGAARVEDTADRAGEKIETGAREAGRDIEDAARDLDRDEADLEPVRYNRTDLGIHWDIARALGEPNWGDNKDIDVAVDEGVVTLSGYVHNETQKQNAAALAKAVEGVKGVTNNLEIRPATGDDDDDDGKALGAAPKPVADKDLDVGVKRELSAYPGLSYTVSGGAVMIRGEVDTYKQAIDAVRAMKKVPGVQSVKTDIKVREAK
jgi:osmotically-inducible protein OsmY